MKKIIQMLKNNYKYIVVIAICIIGSSVSAYATDYLFESKDLISGQF